VLKNVIIGGFILAAVSAATASAPVGTSQITVSGIITPSACSMVVTGASIDFGRISREEVQSSSYANRYILPRRSVNVIATCPSPVRFAFMVTDNRAPTAGAAGMDNFGLGNYTPPGDGEPQHIGYYYMVYQGNTTIKSAVGGVAIAPGSALSTSGTATSGSTWVEDGTSFIAKDKSLGFAVAAGASNIDPLVEAVMNLTVGVELLKSTVDDATSDIVFDGASTITMLVM
jgi:type 1 fimbria pilin